MPNAKGGSKSGKGSKPAGPDQTGKGSGSGGTGKIK